MPGVGSPSCYIAIATDIRLMAVMPPADLSKGYSHGRARAIPPALRSRRSPGMANAIVHTAAIARGFSDRARASARRTSMSCLAGAQARARENQFALAFQSLRRK
jgi:hypothetical protein